jgi:hypothetical protein
MERVPLLGNLKPFGKYVMEHVDQIGGVQSVMALLLRAGLLHGECLTCTGKTIAQNLVSTSTVTFVQLQRPRWGGRGGSRRENGLGGGAGALVKACAVVFACRRVWRCPPSLRT